MVDFARGKLSCGLTLDTADFHPEALFAWLAVRVILSLNNAKDIARVLEAKLVESYMRIPFAVPEHREYIDSGYPSEPILAEAAGCLLDPDCNNIIQYKAPEILLTAFTRGHIAKGEQCELVGRTLWTLGHDAVVTAQYKLSHGTRLRFHRAISVIDWLKALFSAKWHDAILQATPVGNETGPTLEAAFRDVYIHFTHFAQAGEFNAIGVLYCTILRGMAFQCTDNQRSTHMLVGMHHGGIDGPIGPETTSPLFGHVKNRIPLSTLLDPDQAGTPPKGLPVLSILMELGSSEPLVCSHEHIAMSTPNEGKSVHHTHYQIDAYGCTHETYAVIPKDKNTAYRRILAANTVIEEFPRLDQPAHYDALLRQKPAFFANQKQSWDWLSEDRHEKDA